MSIICEPVYLQIVMHSLSPFTCICIEIVTVHVLCVLFCSDINHLTIILYQVHLLNQLDTLGQNLADYIDSNMGLDSGMCESN